MSDHGAITDLQTTLISHTEYADYIALSAISAARLQLQLDRFYTYCTHDCPRADDEYTNNQKSWLSSTPIFQFNGTPLEVRF